MNRIAESAVGDRLSQKLRDHDLVLLGFWENGFRMITNNVRPIRRPEDLKGIKIRTPKDPERIKVFKAFGANPASMSFQEVFSALKQGVIDGQENPLSQIVPSRFHEVQRFLSVSRHVYSPAYPLMSRSYYDSLPAELRAAVMEVGEEVGRYHRELGAREDERLLELLRDQIQINEIDQTAFEALAEPLYEDYVQRFGPELVETVRGYRSANP
jgi:tripartite ATP-independent transporter DctP family solute receptor